MKLLYSIISLLPMQLFGAVNVVSKHLIMYQELFFVQQQWQALHSVV